MLRQDRVWFGVQGHFGFIISHRYTMGHLIQAHTPGFEADVSWKPQRGRFWERQYNHPTVGLAFWQIYLGNPDELGNASNLYPFINFPLGGRDRKFKLYMRYGWGLGWLSNHFDPLENHKNIAIGSHLNVSAVLRLNTQWRLNDNLILESGLGMNHFSNGAFKVPNLGLNITTVNLGLHWQTKRVIPDRWYNATKPRPVPPKQGPLKRPGKWKLTLFGVVGANEIDPPGTKKQMVYNFLSTFERNVSPKSRFGFGFDAMYSEANKTRLAVDSTYISHFDNIQWGAKGVYEMVINRLTLPIEIGYYLHTAYKDNGSIYSRFGARFQYNSHIIVSFTLKTHFARAEYWELGVGYKLWKNHTIRPIVDF